MSGLSDLLLEAPDSQMDSVLKPLVKAWSSPPVALQVLEVLDKAIFGSLASGMVIQVLQAEYRSALETEGKTHDELVKLAVWRNNP